MGIFLGDTAPSKIFVGGSEVASVRAGDTKIRPTLPPYRTFTISWEEKSDMSSGWVYSDDAAGLTAGSTDFDEFFGYSAVKLAADGTETSEALQSSPGVLDITQLGALSGGDNIMIKFPVRGIKMEKSGSIVTLSITDDPQKSGYQYYAFQNTGDTDENTENTPTKNLYIGTYLNSNSNNVLKSRSGQSMASNTNPNTFSYSAANGTGWTIVGWYQWYLINAYYMMKYGNPDSMTTIGIAAASGTTGGTNSQTNATRGNTGTASSFKIFGLEDWLGTQQRLGGVFIRNTSVDYSSMAFDLYVALHDFVAYNQTMTSNYKSIGRFTSGIGQSVRNGGLATIMGNNKGMFGPTSGTGGGSTGGWITHYCAAAVYGSSNNCLWRGWRNPNIERMLDIQGARGTTQLRSRLMYL